MSRKGAVFGCRWGGWTVAAVDNYETWRMP